MVAVYNAKSKEGVRPDLESQVILYNEGKELYRSAAEPVLVDNLVNPGRIPIKKSLFLEGTLQPGDYVLKLLVRDRQAKEKNNLTEQMLQFEISTN